MGKALPPLSKRKKKRRIGAGLQRYNADRRHLSLQTKGTCENEEVERQDPSATSPPAVVHLTGRRIVDINDFITQMKNLGSHGPLGCSITNMDLVREKREGLRSAFVFKCNYCHVEQTVWSESIKQSVMDVNTCAVSGTITTGGGHSQLEEIMSTMDIPPLSDKTFRKYEIDIGDCLMSTAEDEMKKAAAEEAKRAKEMGDVDTDGTPLITVVADGSWGKRSYRTNYSSLSGVAAIVGHYTTKVLYMGVKNKYCTPCVRAEARNVEPKPHTCYKNWGMRQSSSSMEPALIAEGFACSEEMHGVRYARLIADGDSSVYKKILETRPYKTITVEKIECKNHLLRNFCNKLRQISTTTNKKTNTVQLRKKIAEKILNFRTAASKAADHRRKQDGSIDEKGKNLRLDILNIPSHEFGEHKNCLERGGYFCTAESGSDPANLVPALTEAGLYAALTEVVKDLSRHSRSLIANVTSNPVEHYNSIVAKYIGGKRINFALRGSYQGRCSGAVLQFNSGNTHYLLHKKMCESSPGLYTKSTGIKRKRKVDRERSNKRSKKCLFRTTDKPDGDYGPAAQKPDLDEDLMAEETDEFLKSLQKTDEERTDLERETVEQSNSGVWLQTRRNLLTASNYGRVCKMKPTTGCGPLVKQLLYSTFDCEAMAYGRSHEDTARQHLERELGTTIQPCGLFIHPEKMFLGATPDGLIGADGLVEIKCPSSARDMTPEEAIVARKITFWKSQDGEIGDINKTHDYYYQVQGQLNVTGREFCVFAVWTPKGLKKERIGRDNEFWNKMVSKLEQFYMNCIVPEIIDPRHRRSMPIRNPKYIVDAQEKAKSKKKS